MAVFRTYPQRPGGVVGLQGEPGEILVLEDMRNKIVLLPTVRRQTRLVLDLFVSFRSPGLSKLACQCAEIDGGASRY